MNRPEFNPTGLPAPLQAAAIAQSLRSWVVVSGTGFSWFLRSKDAADKKLAALTDAGDAPLLFEPIA